jgi:hypothetical protein
MVHTFKMQDVDIWEWETNKFGTVVKAKQDWRHGQAVWAKNALMQVPFTEPTGNVVVCCLRQMTEILDRLVVRQSERASATRK